MVSIRIDFYLIDGTTSNDIFTFACRLLEKAHQKQQTVFVLTENRADAEKLNDQLWTFHDTSFIPHAIVKTESDIPTQEIPISIGYEDNNYNLNSKLLLNLSPNIPSYHDKFERIIEIVSKEPTWQNISRDHYRKYKAMGYSIQTHDLKVNNKAP